MFPKLLTSILLFASFFVDYFLSPALSDSFLPSPLYRSICMLKMAFSIFCVHAYTKFTDSVTVPP